MSADTEAIADIEKWRKNRDEKCRDPTGWLTLVGLHWLKKGPNTLGRAGTIQFSPSSCPEHLGTITLKDDDTLTYAPHPGVSVEVKGVPVTEVIPIQSDFPDEDKFTLMKHGSMSWFVIKRGQRFGIRVKDTECEVLKNFHGVDNFPINLKFRLKSKFVPLSDGPRKIKIKNALGELEEESALGHVEFSVGDKVHTLLVTGDITKPCMLVFGDATSGDETYGGGRFLWIDPPNANNEVLVDFNKAYNPPCVFTPWATCPLPLPENRLPVRIEAGEKTFGDH